MKRWLAVLLLMVMTVSTVACSGRSSSEEQNETGELILSADQRYFVTGRFNQALFTVEGPEGLGSVTLYDGSGSKVGRMKDDGEDGDAAANDGIYTLKVIFDEDWTGSEETFYAEADDAKSNKLSLYSFTPPETEEEAQEQKKAFDRVMAGIETIEDRYFNDDGYVPEEKYPELTKEIVSLLEEHKGKEVLLYEAEDQYIYIKYTSGVASVYSPAVPNTAGSGNIDLKLWVYQPHPDIQDAGYGEGDGLVKNGLQPSVDNLSNLSFGQEYDGEEVTPGLIGMFPSNAVIYYHGHGAYAPFVKSCLITGVKYDWDRRWNDLAYLILCCKDAIVCGSTDTQTDMACVTSMFFKLCAMDLSNDVILISSCHGLQDDRLAQSMLDNGAEAVLGYTEEVYTSYTERIGIHVLERLCTVSPDTGKYHTLSEALELAKEKYGKNDKEWAPTELSPEDDTKKSTAAPKILGNKDVRLLEDGSEPGDKDSEKESTNPAPETSSPEPTIDPDSVNVMDYWGHFDDLRIKVGITGTSTDPDHFVADPMFSDKPTFTYDRIEEMRIVSIGVDTVEADGARVGAQRSEFEPKLLAKGWELIAESPIPKFNSYHITYEKHDGDDYYQMQITCTMSTDGDPFIWLIYILDHAELNRG